MTETVVVLGAARSGTSVTAGLLARLGVAMDAALGAPDPLAPRGYHESAAANAINKKVFRLAWGGAASYPDDDVSYYWNPPPAAAIRDQAAAVAEDIRAFAAAHAGEPIWGFKNPATCLTLDLYLPHLTNPRFVVVERDLEDNVEACALVYGLPRARVREVLSGYRRRCREILEPLAAPSLTVSYEALKADHRAETERLAAFCGLTLTPERLAAVDDLVVPGQFGLEKYRRPRQVPLPRQLNLGSGKAWHPDFLNIDIDPSWRPDILADLNEPLPAAEDAVFDSERFGRVRLARGGFDLIVANDVLEHVTNLTGLMRSCLDLLSVGGRFEILVPYDLSYGAWQDPTHVRAFNERSWTYYSDWFWYLGWTEARFHVDSLRFVPSELGKKLQAAGLAGEEILRTPRAVDAMQVVLRKVLLSESDRATLVQARRRR